MRRMKGNEKGAVGASHEIALGALAAAVVVATSFLVLVAGQAAGLSIDSTMPVVDRREAILPELPQSAAIPKLDAEAASGR